MFEETTYSAGLYLRLSKDDDGRNESVSIGTQRDILTDYCNKNGFRIYDVYIDDGYSGLNFDRPRFQEMLGDIERGLINMVITKDLSRLGRDYIMTGYYTEIYFQSQGVRYIALADDVDTLKGHNQIAPFKNILNDMYAQDISKKVKNAKHHRAKQGLYIGSDAPYGYARDSETGWLVVDPEAAETVRLILSLAQMGCGGVSIANELKRREIETPSYYKFRNGRTRYARFPSVIRDEPYSWGATAVNHILSNPVYTGVLVSLKTEVVNCKTKARIKVPNDQRIKIPDAHEAIISQELFDEVATLRKKGSCTALNKRFNLFRGKLFCECCGHPLAISKNELLSGTVDMYLCMHHYHRPDECPKTHRIYHGMLYPYVLQQVRSFAASMKRRKVNSRLANYADIEELTPEILENVIERIEISHVSRKAKPGSVIQIYWKLQ